MRTSFERTNAALTASDERLADLQALRHRVQELETTVARQQQALADADSNIADRKRFETVLQDQQDRFRDFIEVSADWFWEQDETFRFTLLSDSYEAKTGLLRDAALGRRWEDILGKSQSLPLVEAIAAHMTFRDLQFCLAAPNGRTSYHSVSGKPVLSSDGRVRGYRGTGRDLTAAVRAESQLASTQQRLLDAIEALPTSFMLFDVEDRLVHCNERTREILSWQREMLKPGVTFEELVRDTVSKGIPDQGNLDPEQWLEERLAAHRAPGPPFEQQRNDGSCVLIQESRTTDGGIVAIRLDITELKRTEQALAEQSAMLQAMLDSIYEGFAAFDKELCLVAWNDRFTNGFDRKTVPDLIHGTPLKDILDTIAPLGVFGPGDPASVAQSVLEQRARMRQKMYEERQLSDGRRVKYAASPCLMAAMFPYRRTSRSGMQPNPRCGKASDSSAA